MSSFPEYPYSHLPDNAAEVFYEWEYKTVKPTEQLVGSIQPTVAFSTVDLKMPAKGPVKILEINGYDSGLTAYGEELREKSIVDRANCVNSVLGVPVGRFRWNGETSRYVEIDRYTHPFTAEPIWTPADENEADFSSVYRDTDLSLTESKLVSQWLLRRRQRSQEGLPLVTNQLADIEDASVLIELSDSAQPPYSDYDPADALIANPAAIRILEDNKLIFDAVGRTIQGGKYRPRAGVFNPYFPNSQLYKDPNLLDEVEKVALKFPSVDGGTGVTVLESHELKTLINLAGKLGSWEAMLRQLLGYGFVSNEEASSYSSGYMPKALLVEEYVPSAPVKAPDGGRYDATMRIVIGSLANREKVTIVPLGAYWKLPQATVDARAHAEVSRVYEGGSLPVSEKDFRRAFRDTAMFMKHILKYTRSAEANTYWQQIAATA